MHRSSGAFAAQRDTRNVLRPNRLTTTSSSVQLVTNGLLDVKRPLGLALFRESVATGAKGDLPVQRNGAWGIDHLWTFSDLYRVLQFVRDRCNQKVSDGVPRINIDAKMAFAS